MVKIDFNSLETETNQTIISDFQMIFNDCREIFKGYFNTTTNCEAEFLDSNKNEINCINIPKESLSSADNTFQMMEAVEFEAEPPLLDELEIYPEQIQEKAIMIANPFACNELAFETFLADIDLSGPLFFCFIFGACLFLAGKVFIFSHVYGLSIMSVLGMYGLLKLMCYGHQQQLISIKGVASALGYGLLHLVWLSFFGIFMQLNTFNGFCFAAFAICLATFGASRILCIMSNQANNCALVAYPTAMIYTLFAFLVTF